MVFALGEAFIFSYIFGIEKGWEEINRGADMKVPRVFKYVIKYVTPAFILVIFVAALIKPAGPWGDAFSGLFSGQGWKLAADSVIGKVLHLGEPGYRWFDEAGYGTRGLVQDMTRVLLALVFATCAFLVWKAWKNKERRAS